MTVTRTRILAGNWKMNHGPSQAARFFADFLPLVEPADGRSVVFFPPAVSFAAAREAVQGRPDVRLGVQNVHWEAGGAFTGELSVSMAADAGAELVLVGHSERRHVFGETIDETVRKTVAVLEGGLDPVLCVGETIDERRADRAEAVVVEQLGPVLAAVPVEHLARLVIAYEPVWAIGTGVTATPADAAAMHAAVRRTLEEVYGAGAAGQVPVLYGGSVKPENAAELMSQPGVDGVLVGGASLDPAGFAAIVRAAG
ncbi:triose-phosphate isomerase [Longimicrobium terrae]|uniref:Triosephosphate isomerase n=1 Tax=Longimicrobium terrae TaxID=1639882 RepID=A0A841H4L8_9BACT|nr:triosephosphate isomerase [Longimicrobium terrae]MBB6072960.1 triosephosphate isomerase [Longimicrobium terrae]